MPRQALIKRIHFGDTCTTQIDRLFDWQRNPNSGVRETLKRQKPNTRDQFDEMVKLAVRQFAEKVSAAFTLSVT